MSKRDVILKAVTLLLEQEGVAVIEVKLTQKNHWRVRWGAPNGVTGLEHFSSQYDEGSRTLSNTLAMVRKHVRAVVGGTRP